MGTKSDSLVTGHLEHISSDIFDRYHDEITKLVAKEHGVYALYKNKRLYYVGLARNLRTRVNQHLKDKHSNRWDTFSLFLVEKAEHLKELESLMLHIFKPEGNRQRGKFANSTNLRRALKKLVKNRNTIFEDAIFGTASSRKHGSDKPSRTRTSRRSSGKLPLESLLTPGTELRCTYKKTEYRATVDESGRIVIDGISYRSPSAAGSAVRGGKATDGWTFWKYRNQQGNWERLDKLRKRL